MNKGPILPRWILWLAAGIFCLGLLGLTGSSWLELVRGGRLITGQPRWQREFFGTSRPIRSDEWSVQTPHARAQQLSEPRFPLVNQNLGLGALQRNTYGIPVLDWGLPFRPLTWPYFLPGRWSFGVFWFFREALLLLALTWLTLEFTFRDAPDRRRANVAAVASLAIFFSSATTWWVSTPMIEFVLFASLTGAAAAFSARTRRRALGISATAYFSACAFCT